MRIRLVVSILFCLIAPAVVFAQDPCERPNRVIIKKYVCLNESYSEFVNEDVSLISGCNGPFIDLVRCGDSDIASVDAEVMPGNFAKIKLTWFAGSSGTILIDVIDRRYHSSGFLGLGCEDERKDYMYTYEISRGDINPAGTLVSTTNYTYTSSVDNPSINASLDYVHTQAYPFPVGAVKYSVDGVYQGMKVNQSSSGGDSPIPIDFNVGGYGTHLVTTEVISFCGTWFPGPSATINVLPTCASNTSGLLSLAGETSENDGSYQVYKDITYTITQSGITDFLAHYDLTQDGGNDVTLAGSDLTVHGGVGSYRVEAVKKAGREACPAIPPMKVFLGWHDIIIEQPCPVILPEDFPDFGLTFDPENLRFEHFAAIVKSKGYIEVMPGLTLEDGAELIIEPTAPVAEGDLAKNFVEATTFDDYGRVIGVSRSYFDDQGRGTQQQSKNLSAGVLLASQTIYDAQGRAVISTLPAPVDVRDESVPANDCPELAGEGVNFEYKIGFVKSAIDHTPYNQAHFDVAKENNPDPVEDTEPGTLGWYYSTNNGTAPVTSPMAALNEPLVAATDFPYSRVLFHHDGSGEAKSSTIPGDAFRAGTSHLATADKEPVTDTDPYLIKYFAMRTAGLGLASPSSFAGNFFRSVGIDEHGKKSVAYTDNAGATIVALYFGTQSAPITKSYQFYDNAGRLLASVSPNGVEEFEREDDPVAFSDIDKTLYKYNYKGWLLSLQETDAGLTEYAYRKDGMIRFSQNDEQRNTGKYSYTNYDRSGRPVESGEFIPSGAAYSFDNVRNNASVLQSIQTDGGLPDTDGTKSQRTFTFYDEPDPTLLSLAASRKQRFVHGAVSYSKKENDITTWYSYDDQGRVEWMVQNISVAGLPASISNPGLKTIDYRYGPTGAVEEVAYQKGVPADQFTHYYQYDLDGRLKKAFTTRQALQYKKTGVLENPEVLQLQATYHYYLHGPLKRVEYANMLQGIDYVYTVDGKLKAINDANHFNDPGYDNEDGNGVRRDVFGLTLDYYTGDYVSGGHTVTSPPYPEGTEDQFGGLIKAARWQSPIGEHKSFLYTYQYDQRNQFREATWGVERGVGWTFDTTLKPYAESIGTNGTDGYDANGNIQLLNRHTKSGSNLADLKYWYKPHTNQLEHVNVGDTSTVFRNYLYNDIGQMTEQEDVPAGKKTKVEYDVTGKVKAVYDISGQPDKLITMFWYDDRGFRLCKTSYDATGNATLATWYVRDASGSVITTYEQDITGSLPLKPVEMPVYAAGRIGMFKPQYNLTFYELTDHLGNVRAVIGDDIEVNYLATMETERTQKEESEAGGFENIKRSSTAGFINHTPATVIVDGETDVIGNPNEVVRINNRPNDTPAPDPIGPGKFLWVHPGDQISAEVFVKYANFSSATNSPVTAIAAYLAGSFGAASYAVDGANIFNGIDQNQPVFAPALANVRGEDPRAFLSYILYDKNFTPLHFDQDQMTTSANAAGGNPHERLSIEVTIEKEGYIYVYVSNQSDQNMDVYFDDLKITHHYSDIVAGADFYPFGLTIDDRQITRERYRFGYQGQYSEKDDETGWSHFELREYDPVVGRWTAVDPKRIGFSPFIGMGNNPIKLIDSDGGDPDDIIFQNNKGQELGRIVTNDPKHEYVNVDTDLGLKDFGLTNPMVIDIGKLKNPNLNAIGFGFELSGTILLGGNDGVEFVYFLDGKDRGKWFGFTKHGINLGFEVSATAYGFEASYMDKGGLKDMNSNSWTGYFNSYSGGVGAAGAGLFWSNEKNEPEFWPNTTGGKTVWQGVQVGYGMGLDLGAKWSATCYHYFK